MDLHIITRKMDQNAVEMIKYLDKYDTRLIRYATDDLYYKNYLGKHCLFAIDKNGDCLGCLIIKTLVLDELLVDGATEEELYEDYGLRKIDFEDGEILYLQNLIVFPGYRRKGVGTQLMNNIPGLIAELGVEKPKKLVMIAENKMGYNFAKKQGFNEGAPSIDARILHKAL